MGRGTLAPPRVRQVWCISRRSDDRARRPVLALLAGATGGSIGGVSSLPPTLRRPPGSLGLPLLGETPAFLANMFAFLETRRRRYGDVFKTRVLGHEIVVLAGVEGAAAFYDEANITRQRAHPFTLLDLFGGTNMAMMDGPPHQAIKRMALTAFDHGSVAGYLPGMQRLLEASLKRLSAAGEFAAARELRGVAIEAIAGSVLGLSPGPETAAITRDYAAVLNGVVSLPLALPLSPYARARAARDRLLARFHQAITERRARPTLDGLSRLLAARAADGGGMTDDEAALEMHHIVIAGFIVYALLAEVLRRLAEQPALRERCAAEVRANAAAGPVTMAQLAALGLCGRVAMEAKRIVPLVPLAFGRARRDFACGGYQVSAGVHVYLAFSEINSDPAIYREPATFDPDRFGEGRAEHQRHPMAFIPQGAEPPTGHRCLGYDYSTVLTTLFVALLVRGYDWELPPQNLAYSWRGFPPAPKDGLLVRLRASS